MNFVQPESPRVKITTQAQLNTLGSTHPFTRRIDVLFPSVYSDELTAALSCLEVAYASGKIPVSEVYTASESFLQGGELQSSLTMLSTTTQGDDVWCVDPRGVLTLSLCKDTYERVGITGKSLPFKGFEDIHAVNIPLQHRAETVGNRAKRKAGLETFDKIRGESWDVLYAYSDSVEKQNLAKLFLSSTNPSYTIHTARSSVTRLESVNIPFATSGLLRPRPPSSSADDLEDWTTAMSELFEWVGMATLGSERLRANDRVDPYISVYTPPSPSVVGDLTHICWQGFLPPAFVQEVIDTVSKFVANADQDKKMAFAAITAHAYTLSPVSYLPPATKKTKGTGIHTPMRVPREDGDDTWCAVLEPTGGNRPQGKDNVRSTMVESVGQWDTRWG